MNGHSTDDFDPTDEERRQADDDAAEWEAYLQRIDYELAAIEMEAARRDEDERGYKAIVGEELQRWTR